MIILRLFVLFLNRNMLRPLIGTVLPRCFLCGATAYVIIEMDVKSPPNYLCHVYCMEHYKQWKIRYINCHFIFMILSIATLRVHSLNK